MNKLWNLASVQLYRIVRNLGIVLSGRDRKAQLLRENMLQSLGLGCGIVTSPLLPECRESGGTSNLGSSEIKNQVVEETAMMCEDWAL